MPIDVSFQLAFPFAGQDQVLHGRIQVPPGPGPYPGVILVNGYKSYQGWGFFPELARRLAAAGILAVRFNGSASGIDPTYDPTRITDLERFSRGTYSQELEDLEQVREHLLRSELAPIDPTRIGLFGYSRGGGMVLLHAAERADYRAVVAWAPMSRVLRFSTEECREWRIRGYTEVREASTGRRLRLGLELLEDTERNSGRLDILAACARSRTPTLLVAAEHDRAVAVADVRELEACFSAGVARLVVAAGVGHGFGAQGSVARGSAGLAGALDLTISHYERHLRADGSAAARPAVTGPEGRP